MQRKGDMIVNLMQLPEIPVSMEEIKIKRALIVDKELILNFIREAFPGCGGWVWETEKALMQNPGKCFIAVKDKKVVGFACYDATTLDYFGPTGVRSDMRGKGIGKILLLRTLHAMREAGYGYAVIGAVSDAAEFYEKTVNAHFIEGGEITNSIYSELIKY